MIKRFGTLGEEICDLEEARPILNFDGRLILADGQRVNSFDELLRLVAQDKYKDAETLQVVVLPAIMGG